MNSISDLLKVSLGSFTLGKLLSAALTLAVCILAVRLLNKLAAKLLSQSKHMNDRLQRILLTALKAGLYIVTGILTADALGVNTSSLTALVSVLTLGLTLAAEDILGNVAGGMILLSSRPFAIGDIIQSGDMTGIVREINLNHTKLETFDGQIVFLPNKELSASRIVNFTALGKRRIVRTVTASYDAPTEDVKAACREALAQVANNLIDPAPEVYLTNYGSSSIEYTVRCWTKPDDYAATDLALNEDLRAAFEHHGVEMTYDHLNVHMVDRQHGGQKRPQPPPDPGPGSPGRNGAGPGAIRAAQYRNSAVFDGASGLAGQGPGPSGGPAGPAAATDGVGDSGPDPEGEGGHPGAGALLCRKAGRDLRKDHHSLPEKPMGQLLLPGGSEL